MFGAVVFVPIDSIVCHPQVRVNFDSGRISEMAVSIKANGVLVPLIIHMVRGEHVLVDGECRWRAAKIAGLKELPAIIYDRELTKPEVLEISMTLSTARIDLKPLERARGLKALINHTGWRLEDAAKRIGGNASSISKTLRLLALPEPIQALIDAGQVPVSVGYRIARIDDAALQAQLAEEVAAGTLTRDALEARLKGRKPVSRGKSARGRGKRHKVNLPLGHGISVAVSGVGATLDAFIECIGRLLAEAHNAPREITAITFLQSLGEEREA